MGLPLSLQGQESQSLDNSQSQDPFDAVTIANTKTSPASEDQLESEKKKPIHKFSGGVAFLSDYRSRGISQTMLQPAVQGEMKYEHISGFYLKAWASNVDGTSNFINNSSSEWNFFLGLSQHVWHSPIEYDVGLLYYYYPGGEAFVPQRVSYDTLEYYISFIYRGLSIKISQTVTDYFGVKSASPPFNWKKNREVPPNGNSRGSPYVEANYDWEPFHKLTANLHVGYQAVINYSQLNYWDWQAGLTYAFEWVNASLYYIATNAKHAYYDVPNHAYHSSKKVLGGPTVVIAVSREF